MTYEEKKKKAALELALASAKEKLERFPSSPYLRGEAIKAKARRNAFNERMAEKYKGKQQRLSQFTNSSTVNSVNGLRFNK